MAANKKQETRANTDTWLSRQDVCDLKKVADGTVRNWEKAGRLDPVTVRRSYGNSVREVIVYDPQQVAKLPRGGGRPELDPGEVAARAFELFDDGHGVRAVVVKVRVPPDRASELRASWEECGGSDMVINTAAHAELTKLAGPFADVAELVERARDAVHQAALDGAVRAIDRGVAELRVLRDLAAGPAGGGPDGYREGLSSAIRCLDWIRLEAAGGGAGPGAADSRSTTPDPDPGSTQPAGGES